MKVEGWETAIRFAKSTLLMTSEDAFQWKSGAESHFKGLEGWYRRNEDNSWKLFMDEIWLQKKGEK